MIRIPRWLFLLMVPVLFFGGCVFSIRPAWWWTERNWIHPVKESDKTHFPVLVRSLNSGFSAAPLGEIPPDSAVVTRDFDEGTINKDLNACIGSGRRHRFFRVLNRNPEITQVTLEVPTRHDSKLQGWYDIRDGEIVPQKIMRYGPGFAFFVMPVTTACGVAVVVIFAAILRPKRPAKEPPQFNQDTPT